MVGKFQLHDSELGAGGYGVVVRATDTKTGEEVAAKMIDKRKMRADAIEREIRLMKLLKHQYIIALLGEADMERHILIFMELAAAGELFSRVISAGSLREEEARPYFQQLLEGVQFMHGVGVAHRDLKLENVLLARAPDGSNVCKICDFGLAHRYEADGAGKVLKPKPLKETCGSKSYCAPEVLDGRGYDGFDADSWSCGICLFAMLAGFFPLDEATGADWRFERVKLATQSGMSTARTIYSFYDRPCILSPLAVGLIDGMLTVVPSRRLKVGDVLDSPWFTEKIQAMDWSQSYDEAPRYRGQVGTPDLSGMSAQEAMAALEAAAGGQGQGYGYGPVYRGGAIAQPPGLAKQQALFCPDIHLADGAGPL